MTWRTHSITTKRERKQLLPEDGSMVSAQQEEITTWCSQGIYGTGVHTKHAQAEIDSVVRQDQFQGQKSFRTSVKCTHPGAPPLGTRGSGSSRSVSDARLLHHAMREGVYEGHCIPKGPSASLAPRPNGTPESSSFGSGTEDAPLDKIGEGITPPVEFENVGVLWFVLHIQRYPKPF
ncbi:hypothetical protein BD769DRAFT_1387381 [Suillus cothurnatus]|nr:hypothetical protein BD769DRAFT_1387381 [Suillus cothurnatus]